MVKRPRVQDGTDGDEEFLQRWSRRKAAARNSTGEAEAAREREPSDELRAHTRPAGPEPPPKTDADMPPIESIDASTDMRDFFSPEVTEELRRVALRKLFHLPQFNVVDGLDDYDDDFTTFEALGDVVTADMRHQLELKQERLASSPAEESAEEDGAEIDASAHNDAVHEDAAQSAHTDTEEQHGAESRTAAPDLNDESAGDDDDHRNS